MRKCEIMSRNAPQWGSPVRSQLEAARNKGMVKVLALDMGNGNLIACLSTHKHREVVVPLFALTSKLATTISKDLFPRHEIVQFMGRDRSLWKRLPSHFHRYAYRAIFPIGS